MTSFRKSNADPDPYETLLFYADLDPMRKYFTKSYLSLNIFLEFVFNLFNKIVKIARFFGVICKFKIRD